MSVTNRQRVHHNKTNSYQQSPTSQCIHIKSYQNSLLSYFKRVIIKAISVLAQYDELFFLIANRSLLLVNTSQLAENLNYFK